MEVIQTVLQAYVLATCVYLTVLLVHSQILVSVLQTVNAHQASVHQAMSVRTHATHQKAWDHTV